MTQCDSFTRVLLHASASLTAERRHLRVVQICTSVKCNPVGISNNIFMASLPAQPGSSNSRPPNLPLRTVPIPGTAGPSAGREDPDHDKWSKSGSCVIISRTCTRVTILVLRVKDVTDFGNLQDKGLDGRTPPCPKRNNLSTFVNHAVYSKNSSGTGKIPPIQMNKSLAWRAGLSSGSGNVSNHLSIPTEVNSTARKRRRWQDGTHDLDTREQDRREVAST